MHFKFALYLYLQLLIINKFQKARRSCVERVQKIDMYKEDESETTCTLGSDDEDSEDEDDDADESSIQEDVDFNKTTKSQKDKKQKINKSNSSTQETNKGKVLNKSLHFLK